MHEAQVNMRKADILHKRAKGTAQLVRQNNFRPVCECADTPASLQTYLTMKMRR
jgi:hypothetical protein